MFILESPRYLVKELESEFADPNTSEELVRYQTLGTYSKSNSIALKSLAEAPANKLDSAPKLLDWE